MCEGYFSINIPSYHGRSSENEMVSQSAYLHHVIEVTDHSNIWGLFQYKDAALLV